METVDETKLALDLAFEALDIELWNLEVARDNLVQAIKELRDEVDNAG